MDVPNLVNKDNLMHANNDGNNGIWELVMAHRPLVHLDTEASSTHVESLNSFQSVADSDASAQLYTKKYLIIKIQMGYPQMPKLDSAFLPKPQLRVSTFIPCNWYRINRIISSALSA